MASGEEMVASELGEEGGLARAAVGKVAMTEERWAVQKAALVVEVVLDGEAKVAAAARTT